jgi:hypothetical protein
MRLVVRATYGSCTICLAAIAIAPGLSHWRSRHLDEAVVGGNTAATCASPIPRRRKECESVNDVRLCPDVEDEDGERHARSCGFSRQWQGRDGQRPKGAWTSLARDQGEP